MTEKTEHMTNGDGRAAPGAESKAEDSASFEDLLRDFETKTSDPAKPKIIGELKEVVDYVRADRTEKQQAQLTKDLESALDFVSKADGLSKVPKPILRGLMEAYATEDQAFASAFQKRHQSPAEWQAQLERGRSWAQEQMKGLLPKDTKKRDDLEAAKAAVAGTETEASDADEDLPSAAAMFNMSGSDWQRFLNEQRAKAAQR